MKYVISFDITSNKTRTKVVKILLEYGYRVQKSVFEGYISKEAIHECQRKIDTIINQEKDSVRIYPLCKECEEKAVIKGTGTIIEKTEYIIV